MTTTIIEKLLAGAEVEWISLDQLVKTITPPSKVKKGIYQLTGKMPIIDQGEKFIAGYIDENYKPVPLDNYVIFGDHSEHIKYIDFAFIQGADGLKILKPKKDNAKYIYYSLQNFYQKRSDYKRHWSDAKKTLIPIPPLSVQKEIVRILDAFTAHTAKLTAELTAELNERQKQYNYYRDKLLTFSETEVEWKTLGDIACYSNSRIRYQALTETNYVGVDNLKQNRGGKNDSKFVPKMGSFQEFLKGDILIGNIRPYLKKIWLSNQVGGASGDILVIRVNDNKIYNKYLYQILSDDKFFNYYIQYSKGAKMPRGDKKSVLDYILPVPSLEKQKKIVSILDKFEALINSITEGLPREIELRNKQYEYYRDQLLNFPKPEDKVEKQNVCELVK